MQTIYRNRSRFTAILICIVLCVTSFGCGRLGKNEESKVHEGIPTDADLQAQDTAILLEMDTDLQTVILQTVDNGGRYQLSYDGTTDFSDKYGGVKSAVQMEQGSIVDVVMSVHSKMMKSMQMSAQAFDLRNVDAHDINQNRGVMEVGDSNYRITDDLVVMLGGYVGDVRDINENDILTVRGIDRQVYAVELEKGHGYLRLKGEQSFLGGWVEVGRVIKPISENMLVLLPEGDHEMRISYHGKGGSKPIHIDRDKETVIDVSDLKGSILQLGKVAFDITPSNAKLWLDGVETDYLLPVELEYGVHQMDITCDGYVPIHKYLSVGKEKATIEITMEKLDESEEDEDSDEGKSDDGMSSSKSTSSTKKSTSSTKKSSSSTKKSSSSSSSSSSKSTSSSEYEEPEDEKSDEDETISTTPQIHIDGPEGVEVYFDGEYKGIAPVQFDKESGVHVITLRKEGYITRSYTLTFTAGDEDESYSFNELVPDEEWVGDDDEDDYDGNDDPDETGEPVDEKPEDPVDEESPTDDSESPDEDGDDSDDGDDAQDKPGDDDGSDDNGSDDSNDVSQDDNSGSNQTESDAAQSGQKPVRASDAERALRQKNKVDTTVQRSVTRASDAERQRRKKRY